MFLREGLPVEGTLFPELQRYKDTVRGAAPGAEVPGYSYVMLTLVYVLVFLLSFSVAKTEDRKEKPCRNTKITFVLQ